MSATKGRANLETGEKSPPDRWDVIDPETDEILGYIDVHIIVSRNEVVNITKVAEVILEEGLLHGQLPKRLRLRPNGRISS